MANTLFDENYLFRPEIEDAQAPDVTDKPYPLPNMRHMYTPDFGIDVLSGGYGYDGRFDYGGDSAGQGPGSVGGTGGLGSLGGVTSQGVGQAAGVAAGLAGALGVSNAGIAGLGVRGLADIALDGQISPATVNQGLNTAIGIASKGNPAIGLMGRVALDAAQGKFSVQNVIEGLIGIGLNTLGPLGMVANALGLPSAIGRFADTHTLNNPEARDGVFGYLTRNEPVDYLDADMGKAMRDYAIMKEKERALDNLVDESLSQDGNNGYGVGPGNDGEGIGGPSGSNADSDSNGDAQGDGGY